jgi:hypothetical protein
MIAAPFSAIMIVGAFGDGPGARGKRRTGFGENLV